MLYMHVCIVSKATKNRPQTIAALHGNTWCEACFGHSPCVFTAFLRLGDAQSRNVKLSDVWSRVVEVTKTVYYVNAVSTMNELRGARSGPDFQMLT